MKLSDHPRSDLGEVPHKIQLIRGTLKISIHFAVGLSTLNGSWGPHNRKTFPVSATGLSLTSGVFTALYLGMYAVDRWSGGGYVHIILTLYIIDRTVILNYARPMI